SMPYVSAQATIMCAEGGALGAACSTAGFHGFVHIQSATPIDQPFHFSSPRGWAAGPCQLLSDGVFARSVEGALDRCLGAHPVVLGPLNRLGAESAHCEPPRLARIAHASRAAGGRLLH